MIAALHPESQEVNESSLGPGAVPAAYVERIFYCPPPVAAIGHCLVGLLVNMLLHPATP